MAPGPLGVSPDVAEEETDVTVLYFRLFCRIVTMNRWGKAIELENESKTKEQFQMCSLFFITGIKG